MSRLRVLAYYFAARRRRFEDRDALFRWQEKRVRRVLEAAPRRYALYRGLFPDGPPGALSELPILDKADVVAQFAGLNVRHVELAACLAAARAAEQDRDFTASLQGLTIGLSSGTSGKQTAFLTSAAERDRWAGEILARVLPWGFRQSERVTLVLRAGGPLYESVGGGRVSFTFVDLALPRVELVRQVTASQPTILVAPPSVLTLLSDDVRAVRVLRSTVRRVLSGAEVLDPHNADHIRDALGLRVDQVYQAAEGFLGLSCSEGTIHLTEDLIIFEYEQLSGPRVNPIITDLFRTSQAVIRRRLGDVLLLDEDPCVCGSVLQAVRSIAGRTDDVLMVRTSQGTLTEFYPDFIRAAVLAVTEVQDFQVTQISVDAWTLAVTPTTAFSAAHTSLHNAIQHTGNIAPTITPTSLTLPGPLIKLRRIHQKWRPPT